MIGVFEAIKIGTNFCDTQKDTPYFGRCVVIRDIIFFKRFQMLSLGVMYRTKTMLISHEPLDNDRARYALQKCQ